MRSLYVSMGLAILFVQPLFAFAQTLPSLTLAHALQRALQNSPDLSLALKDLEIADAQLKQAGAWRNPELSVLAEGLQRENRTSTVQLNQTLELGGKRAARINVAEFDRSIASADLDQRRIDVHASVVTAFFQVLMAQEKLTLAQTSQQLSQRATEAASRRVAAGKIAAMEEVRAKVAETSSKISVNQASSELLVARQKLAATWGNTLTDFAEVAMPDAGEGHLPALPELSRRLASSPALQRAALEIQKQQAIVRQERSKRIPDLTISLGGKRDEQVGRSQVIVGFSIPLALFDNNQGNVLGALRKTERAREEQAMLEKKLTLALAEIYQQHQLAMNELQVLKNEILPPAQMLVDASIKGFELGKFSFLEVQDAQRSLLQSRLQYLNTLAESYRTSAEIQRLTGSRRNEHISTQP
ncbi:TolC family protein [Undibacterium sp. TJN19]|uniref:TolC family protein n=1 Tax=Undibacterium sp. TJN19 TaxID=3413055 RepID=UPI003BF0E549